MVFLYYILVEELEGILINVSVFYFGFCRKGVLVYYVYVWLVILGLRVGGLGIDVYYRLNLFGFSIINYYDKLFCIFWVSFGSV